MTIAQAAWILKHQIGPNVYGLKWVAVLRILEELDVPMSEPKMVTCDECDGTGVMRADKLTTVQRQLDAVDAAIGFPDGHGHGRIELIRMLQLSSPCKCGVRSGVSHYCASLNHCWVGARGLEDDICSCSHARESHHVSGKCHGHNCKCTGFVGVK